MHGFRITKRGVIVIVLGVLLALLGRLFGIAESLVGGIIIGTVVVWSLLSTLFRRNLPDDFLERVVPNRISVDQAVSVELVATTDRWATPIVTLREKISSTSELCLRVAPVLPAASPTNAPRTQYRFRPDRRGQYSLGPGTFTWMDPFRLFQRQLGSCPATPVVAWPKIRPGGIRLELSSEVLSLGGTIPDDEPADLRAYVPGDDPRRVHWPNSARRGELMVRQSEPSAPDRHTEFLVDARSTWHNAQSLELALSVAATLMVGTPDATLRLLTDENDQLATQVDSALDLLAFAPPIRPFASDSAPVLRHSSGKSGTVLVVITGPDQLDVAKPVFQNKKSARTKAQPTATEPATSGPNEDGSTKHDSVTNEVETTPIAARLPFSTPNSITIFCSPDLEFRGEPPHWHVGNLDHLVRFGSEPEPVASSTRKPSRSSRPSSPKTGNTKTASTAASAASSARRVTR